MTAKNITQDVIAIGSILKSNCAFSSSSFVIASCASFEKSMPHIMPAVTDTR